MNEDKYVVLISSKDISSGELIVCNNNCLIKSDQVFEEIQDVTKLIGIIDDIRKRRE